MLEQTGHLCATSRRGASPAISENPRFAGPRSCGGRYTKSSCLDTGSVKSVKRQ